MKRIQSLTAFGLIILLLNACKTGKSAEKSGAAVADTSALSARLASGVQNNIDVFLAGFELAVLSHDAKRIMPFMDKDYRTQQHDSLMQKNTALFLNRFFSGYTAGNVYRELDYTKITNLRKTDLQYTGNYYTVTYTLESGSVHVSTSWVVLVSLRGPYLVYGLYGPFGNP